MVGSDSAGTGLWPTLSNQVLALFAVWATALIGEKHKRMAEELRCKEQDLSEFLENAPVGIQWVGKDGRIMWANREELNLIGYTKPEYIGHHLSEFYADSSVLPDILDRIKQGQTLINYEARLRCKDGSIQQVIITPTFAGITAILSIRDPSPEISLRVSKPKKV